MFCPYLGVGVLIVGLFGIIGNIATIIVLRQKKRPCTTCWNFRSDRSDFGENRSMQDNNRLFKNRANPNSSSIINMNDCFYKLLIGLAVIDVILILHFMAEISIIGVFMGNIQPRWYKVCF